MGAGLPDLGRMLMVLGGVVFVVGLVLSVAGHVPGLGRLPGDFVHRRGSFTLYVPLATCILLSLLLTLVLSLWRR